MIDINLQIKALVDYGQEKGLIDKRDRVYVINHLLDILDLDQYEELEEDYGAYEGVEDILEGFRRWAVEKGRVEDSVQLLDLYDTRIMSALVKMPSQIEGDFWEKYKESPKEATDYYYCFAKNSNYIREKRIAKDIKWLYHSPYGLLDITINMSKPEKDPRLIAQALKMESSNYPKCVICAENEGYRGRINADARNNHRLIQLELAQEEWYLQYSPYVYYNEHCIVLKGEHVPMKINRLTFQRLLEFVEIFPHYFIGSNAGLPIVGGSILSHDHFQGGRYDFAMAQAEEENFEELKGGVRAYTLKWPMSVIRLKGENIEGLIDAAEEVLSQWEDYSDPSVDILSHSEDTPHNAITPIARFRDGFYQLDLVLRNNRTSQERPDGIFHPRQGYHNIKKENIGLIEVMGLAVLPSRLKQELEELKSYLLGGNLQAIKNSDHLSKHYEFAYNIKENYQLNEDNIDELLEKEVGRIFLLVLEDAGLFKNTSEGRQAFSKCRKKLFENLRR